MTSSASSASRSRTWRSVAAGVSPGDQLLIDEPDRVAGLEPALGVVASGLGNGAGPQPPERISHRRRVLMRRAPRVEADRGDETRLQRPRRHHLDGPVRQLGRALGRHQHVGAVRQHDDLLGRHAVDRRQQVGGRGIELGPAVQRRPTPSEAYSSLKPSPVTTASAPQMASVGVAPLPPWRGRGGTRATRWLRRRRSGGRRAWRPARSCRRCRCGRRRPPRRPARLRRPGRRCGRGPSASSRRRRPAPNRRSARARG